MKNFQKVREITGEEAKKIDFSKIQYIALSSGEIVYIKKEQKENHEDKTGFQEIQKNVIEKETKQEILKMDKDLIEQNQEIIEQNQEKFEQNQKILKENEKIIQKNLEKMNSDNQEENLIHMAQNEAMLEKNEEIEEQNEKINLENLAIRVENEQILEKNEELNLEENKEIADQKDQIETQNVEINLQNAEIKIQNQELFDQNKEIKEELNKEIKQEIKNEIKEQIEKSPEEVVIVELEKPKDNKSIINKNNKTIKANKAKICQQYQNLCPECQRKNQQKNKANEKYGEYPYYVVYQTQYEEEPQYYQEFNQQAPYQEKCSFGKFQYDDKTFKPRTFSSEEYQNLLKKAKPMFTVLNNEDNRTKKGNIKPKK